MIAAAVAFSQVKCYFPWCFLWGKLDWLGSPEQSLFPQKMLMSQNRGTVRWSGEVPTGPGWHGAHGHRFLDAGLSLY